MKEHFNWKLKMLNMLIKSIMYLPTPSSLNYMWNFGSLLGVILMSQIITGFFLSMFYNSSIYLSFDSILHIMNNVNSGWLIRFLHSTGASVFFMICYVHISKALYYSSFYLWKVWYTGFLLLMVLMAVAFLGYVLPWGQMSMWGATVITNLISVIPFLGPIIVNWLWGSFNVSGPTLTRFFSFHFILPFIMVVLVVFHLMFLHELGSSNPLGVALNLDKISFKNFFVIKDIYTLILLILGMLFLSLHMPFFFMDSENFIKANPMITPLHIQPEWYFLFAYAILRAVPNKLGGVIMLLMSILAVFMIPMFNNANVKGLRFGEFKLVMLLFTFGSVFVMLTWLGMKPVEEPFLFLSKFYSIVYFILIFIYSLL